MSGREDHNSDWITHFFNILEHDDALTSRVAQYLAANRLGEETLDREVCLAFVRETGRFFVQLRREETGIGPAGRAAIGQWAQQQTGALISEGIALDSFWEMMKLARQILRRLTAESAGSPEAARLSREEEEACLDALEYGLVRAWVNGEIQHYQCQLKEAHHFILIEKRRYHAIFHKIKEPAIVVDGDRRILDVNRAFETFSGKKARALRGENCCAVIGRNVCAECDLERVLATRGSFSDIEIELDFDDRRRCVVMAGTYLGLINGVHAGWIIIFQDITERRTIEARLRESEEKYRSLVQNMPDVTWRSDETGRILFISPNVEQLTGFLPEEIASGLRNGWFARIHPLDRDMVAQAIGLLFSRGRQLNVRYRFLHRDGQWIWIHERSGMTYVKDDLRMADGVLTDVTRMKEIEDELARHHLRLAEEVDKRTAELQQANKILHAEIAERLHVEEQLMHLAERLKASNRELEQFAHVASHDLKEPLLLIIAFGERLLKRCGTVLDDKNREFLNRILRAARQMQLLIDDLLELSRVTTQGNPFERIDLTELMAELMQHLEERVNREQARIYIHSLHNFNGDRIQVWQLFMNIINNALKYRKDTEPPIIIIKSREMEGNFVEITVEDNGIGFEERFLDEIFTPFKRLHGRDKYEGTGIGLATCKKIVLRHGGEITARSKVGAGSTFIIRLPLQNE